MRRPDIQRRCSYTYIYGLDIEKRAITMITKILNASTKKELAPNITVIAQRFILLILVLVTIRDRCPNL